MTGLVIDGVTKTFGGLQVLDHVTMTVEAGALAGLIGPNGAGKSTLFAVVSGYQPADSGTVSFDGRDLAGYAVEARARTGIGRTFQIPRPFGHLTVQQNLAVAAPDQDGEQLVNVFLRPGRVAAREQEVAARVEEIIAFLRLEAVADTPAMKLSGGQKKLLELGRALMTEPRFLLLDEPFAGVNPRLIDDLAERIAELNARDIGCLVVEHNIQALSKLVRRMFVMDWGRILAQGEPQEVLADPAVQDAYIGGNA